MHLVYPNLIPARWLCWAAYWWAMARDVKATVRRESMASRLMHIVPLGMAVLLLWVRHAPVAVLGLRFIPKSASIPCFWAGALLTLAGLLFSVWARVYLGRNWSGTVTLKQGHELVTTGPYGIVRHPIYTGLLLAFVGSALARGDFAGVLAVALVAGSFWRKLRMEERWMREVFGEQYVTYSMRVAALVPFVL